jgi:hypothetical protein
VIEFEREWQGGRRAYYANVADIIDLQPFDEERTLVLVRNRGEVIALAQYPRMKRAISRSFAIRWCR